MNEIEQLYQELKQIYPNRTVVLDAPLHKDTGHWWLDIDRVGLIYKPIKESHKFEVWACAPGCDTSNHVFDVHGDVCLNTKEEALVFVKSLLDHNEYTCNGKQ